MTKRRKWTAIPGLLVLAIGAVMLSAYSGASSSQHSSPVQPINFPHPVHVQKLGMNCVYCHFAVNRSMDPGMPALSTCMGCHNMVGPKRPANDLHGNQPYRSAELVKLYGYAGKDSNTAGVSMPLPPTAKPIPWIRIHKVPEYVHFPHMRHVNAGVTCQTCHGQIQKMDRVYQYSSLNMGWCVSCHVNGYVPKEGQEAAGYEPQQSVQGQGVATAALAAASTERKKARYDCANCHY
ncbi:MAG TPA: cytochrome c3 family protein [Gemmatimonadaceae bacterium]|nr:cytochrome c3 family protein [Gemmatimonadaceae bacterium]